MAELNPALAAALRGDRPLLFGAVEIALPGYTLRLLDGSGQLMIGGQKFVGRDETYGVLDTIKGLGDSKGDQAPALTLGLIPASDSALGTLLDPAVKGSPVTVMMGVIDIATGLVVPSPYVLFAGELDVPTVTWDANDRRVDYSVTSVAERLFATEEGRRLSDSFHQKVWPGELGLAFVTGVEDTVPWGQALDTGAVEYRSNLPGLAMTYART